MPSNTAWQAEAASAGWSPQAAGAGGWYWERPGRIRLDEAAAAHCGLPAGPAELGLEAWEGLLRAEDLPGFRTAWRALLAGAQDTLHLALGLRGQAQGVRVVLHGRAVAQGRQGVTAVHAVLLRLPGTAAPAPRREGLTGVAAIGHELRTPLNAIVGFTRLARRQLPQRTFREAIQPIEDACALMLRVVNDLLDLARLEAGQLRIDAGQALDLPALVTRVGQLGASLRHGTPVRLYASVDEACPARLRGDVARIEQVLLNLLGNALKFTDQGTVALRVRHVGAAGACTRLRFMVSDTGTGIAWSRLGHLGQPFERGTGEAGAQPEGTGLGLAVVQRLLALMDSELRIASVDGGGTLAWFDLVLEVEAGAATCAPRPDAAVAWTGDDALFAALRTQWRAHGHNLRRGGDDAAAAPGLPWIIDLDDARARVLIGQARRAGIAHVAVTARPAPASVRRGRASVACVTLPLLSAHVFAGTRDAVPAAPDAALEGLRVLVVEDERLNQRAMAESLRALGVRCRLAASAGEALEWLGREHYDLALLDLGLPDMPGFELAGRLRRHPNGSRLPLAFCSAHVGSAEQARAASLGALACLLKPLAPQALQALLRQVRGLAPLPAGGGPAATAATPNRQLLPLFAAQQRTLVARIEESAARCDTPALRDAVHALRGALALLGDARCVALARRVEEALAGGSTIATVPLRELLAAVQSLALQAATLA